jgi:hypothetical protein
MKPLSGTRSALVLACLVLVGCGKDPAAQPSANQGDSPVNSARKAARAGVLTLNASGDLLDPDGKAFPARGDAERHIKNELARAKEARTTLEAPRQATIRQVYPVLVASQKIGFRTMLLGDAEGAAKPGPVVTLIEPPKNPEDAELELGPPVLIRIRATAAGKINKVILKMPFRDQTLTLEKWPEQLGQVIRKELENQNLGSSHDVGIYADPLVSYGTVREAAAVCAAAGLKVITIADPLKKADFIPN